MENVWRWSGEFSPSTIDETLQRAAHAGLNFSGAPDERLTPACGWNHVLSHAVIAVDTPGLPASDGAFARARELVLRLAFSDPRIVVPHLPGPGPLHPGDVAILELKTFGPRFLGPVRVAAIREEQTPTEARFRLALETLSGHIERGREWFTLAHSYATGQVRFRIEARWRAGEFPAFWAWAGFEAMGRRYQRAWHHLAHERLRFLLRKEAESAPPERPVTFYARKSLGAWRADVEFEREHTRRDRLLLIAGLGTLSGVRSVMPLTWLTARHVTRGRSETKHPLLTPKAVRLLVPAALGELVADKLPFTPNRTHPLSLAGRALMGGTIGHVLGAVGQRTRRLAPVLLGAGSAVAGAFGSFYARRALSRKLGTLGAALVEDAALLAATGALATRLLPAPSARRSRHNENGRPKAAEIWSRN